MKTARNNAGREGTAFTRKIGIPDEFLPTDCTFISAPCFSGEDTVLTL
jgi:hypothetical protein